MVRRWPWAVDLLVLVVLGITVSWVTGRLDRYLPSQAQATNVIGVR
jgi:hypothetical protein